VDMSGPVPDLSIGIVQGLSIVGLEQSGHKECRETVAGSGLGVSGASFVSLVLRRCMYVLMASSFR
jgi:hypothetical protein